MAILRCPRVGEKPPFPRQEELWVLTWKGCKAHVDTWKAEEKGCTLIMGPVTPIAFSGSRKLQIISKRLLMSGLPIRVMGDRMLWRVVVSEVVPSKTEQA